MLFAKKLLICFVNNDMNLLRISLALLNGGQQSCLQNGKHRAGNIFKYINFYFADVYHLQRRFNDVVYDVDHIVEDELMINDSVNCLFAVYKLSI